MPLGCDPGLLSLYLTGQLELEEKLDLLLHVDTCDHCRHRIYELSKAQHPHFYRSPAEDDQTPDGLEDGWFEVA